MMKTALITIDACANKRYPIRLAIDDGKPDWWQRPALDVTLPETLALKAPLIDGASLPVDAALLTSDAIRKFILAEKGSHDRFAVIGRYLFQLLEDCGIGKAWRQAREQERDGLRTILDVRAPVVRQLPWELLLSGLDYLCIVPGHPILRGEINFAEKAQPEEYWIRVLIIVGSAPKAKEVLAEEELLGLHAVLNECRGTILERTLYRPPLKELREVVKQFKPHVVHFIGHCYKTEDSEAYLQIATPGGSWMWDPETIAMTFASWTPSLVFLNACRSSDLAEDGLWKITDAFKKARAFIGMQADITGVAAARLSGPIYRAIASGTDLDVGLADARRDVVATSADLKRRDWALPVLMARVPPDKILPLTARIDSKMRDSVNADPHLKVKLTRVFFDREPQRHDVGFGIRPYDKALGRTLLPIVGPEDSGKTSLLCWCVQACRLWDWIGVYADMDHHELSFLQVLRRIRNEVIQSTPDALKNSAEKAFSYFNYHLNNLERYAAGKLKLADPSTLPTTQEQAAHGDSSWRGGDPERATALVSQFAQALRQIAQQRPMVIALDHLRVPSNEFREQLVAALIRPIARGDLGPVRMLLAFTEEDISIRFRDGWRDMAVAPIRVGFFEKKNWADFAFDYVRLHHPTKLPSEELMKDAKMVIDLVAKRIGAEWSPRQMYENLQVFLTESAGG